MKVSLSVEPKTIRSSPVVRNRYFAIDPAALKSDRRPGFDLFLRLNDRMRLYCEATQVFTEEQRAQLTTDQVTSVFVDERQRVPFLEYLEVELGGIVSDRGTPLSARVRVAYTACKTSVGDLFAHPHDRNRVRRTRGTVEALHSLLETDTDAFRCMMTVADSDYTLESHSTHVCVYALCLAGQLGIKDRGDCLALGLGALMHDIGKTRIDARIMRKRAPLSHAEFELMKKHIPFGLEIVGPMPDLPRDALIPVLLHNEREDGSGYPGGLTGDRIHLYGKITGVADVFDAMTQNREFRPALSTYDALRAMLDMPLDTQVVRALIDLLAPATRT